MKTVTLRIPRSHRFRFAGVYAALEKGFYQESGLNVVLMPEGPDSKTVVQAILDNDAQYGISDSEILCHRLRGEPLVVLAAIFQYSPQALILSPRSNIHTLRELEGCQVKMPPLPRRAELCAMFLHEGISPDKLHLIPGDATPEDLLNPRIDAISGNITDQLYRVREMGMSPLLIKPGDYGIHFYGDCLFTTENEVMLHPETVFAFRQATLYGWRYAMDHPNEVVDIIINKYNPTRTRAHLVYEADKMQDFILPNLVDIGHMNPGRWNNIAEYYIKLGLAESDRYLDGFIYNPASADQMKSIRWVIWTAGLIVIVVLLVTFILYLFNKRLREAVYLRTFELSRINRQLVREISERKIAEFELRQTRENLELLILERTTELLDINRQLKKEIQEREATAAAFRKSETEKKAILNGMTRGLIYMDLNRNILWMNRAVEKIANKAPEDVIGNRCQQLWDHPEICEHCTALDVLRKKQTVRSVCRLQDGRILDKKSDPVFDDSGEMIGVLELFEDITAQNRMTEQIEQARKMEAVSVLAGGIAHEFNNALFGISGNVELLQSLLPDSFVLQKYSKAILDASDRMKRLTEKLLAYACGGRYNVQTISLNDFVTRTLPMIEYSLNPDIDIIMELGADVCDIEADYTQMQMVFSAILSNSDEAIEESGHIRITTRNHIVPELSSGDISGFGSGEYACLVVEDNGRGMDAETRKRIFEPFFTTNFQGRGLGMAASYGIVRNHDGWIEVTSSPGKGTTVYIYLPAASKKEREIPEKNRRGR